MAQATDSLRDKVTVITGAGAGIGEGLARAAVELGMKVSLSDISAERVDAVARSLRDAGADTIAVKADVTQPEDMQALADRTYEAFGAVDLLVNNAGIEVIGYIWNLSPADWRKTMNINVLGVVHGLQAFVPRMLAAGKPAAIANLSSVGGLGMTPLQGAYIVSKHAVLSLTECLALEMELLEAPIKVSAVLPGPVASRIFEDVPVADTDPMITAHHDFMKAMLRDHGLPTIEAGRRILKGIAAGEFWVTPHPEMVKEKAIDRGAYTTHMRSPKLSAQMKAAFGR